MPVEDRGLAGLLVLSQVSRSEHGTATVFQPEFVDLAIPSHALQRFSMNAEQLCRFIAVQKWLEDEFISCRDWLGRERTSMAGKRT